MWGRVLCNGSCGVFEFRQKNRSARAAPACSIKKTALSLADTLGEDLFQLKLSHIIIIIPQKKNESGFHFSRNRRYARRVGCASAKPASRGRNP